MSKTLIIAEAGVNHNGKFLIAKKLIKEAKDIGADIIKFQYFKAEKIAIKSLNFAPYQKNNSKFKNQFAMLKNLELTDKEFILLYKYSKKIGIKFCLSFFDHTDFGLLQKLRVDFIKIPSGEINNLLLLINAASLKKKIIFSTGMSNYKEINFALRILKKRLKEKNITILQCTSSYPAPFRDLNLRVIEKLKKKYRCNIGFSDHSLGIEASVAAVVLGATIIEKHFTLNNNLIGPDHKASLDVKNFKRLVCAIRNIEQSMGTKKGLMRSEKKNFKVVRKNIVAKKNITKGEIFSLKNLTTKRSNSVNGLDPNKIFKVIGKKSQKNYKVNDVIFNIFQ